MWNQWNKRSIRQSPSLLHSRRKLSPIRAVERDDFIDTADLVLNKEIGIIHKLMKLKVEKEQELASLRVSISEEKRRVEKVQEVQPKIFKQIEREKERGEEIKDHINTINYFTEKEKQKREDLEQNYYNKIIEKLRGIKEQVAINIGVERNEIIIVKEKIDSLKSIVFWREEELEQWCIDACELTHDLKRDIKSVENIEKRRQKDVEDMKEGLDKVLKKQCHVYVHRK